MQQDSQKEKSMSTARRLDQLYEEAETVCFGSRSRMVLMSDCHRGVANQGDNFLKNQQLVFAALSFYNDRKFTYVELGDGDELWENKKLSRIVEAHSDVFWLMSCFYRDDRFLMLYGNHDRVKENGKYLKRHCERYYCDSVDCERELFCGIRAREGVRLTDRETGDEILLVHGHQGDLFNDTLWKLSRFLVRHLWRRLELFGVLDPTSAAKNYKRKKRTEKRLSGWADAHHVMVIAGHTHRPVLPTPGESLYVNDGSCVHPRCITAIEIDGGMITLVKWCTLTRADRSLYVGREVLAGPFRLRDYFR